MASLTYEQPAEKRLMTVAPTIRTRPVLIFWLLLPLVLIGAACERESDKRSASGTTAADEAAGDSFAPPAADVSRLSEALQERVRRLRDQIKKAPGNPGPMGALGAIYFVHGFPRAAAECFARASELAPQSIRWRYYAALARDRADELEKAITAYERVLELDANHGPSCVKLARLLVGSDRQRAATLCERALALDPKDPGAVLGLGLCAAATQEYETALAHAQRALDLVPDYGAAHLLMARALAALHREPEAAQHRAAARQGIAPLGNDDLLETLLRNGFHRDTLIQDALLLAERGFFDQAEKALAMAREVDPAGTAAHEAIGKVRAMQGRLEEATKEFRLVLEAKPKQSHTRADLAGVLARLGNYIEAETEFRAALTHSPDSPYVLQRYVQLLMDLERPREAEHLLWKAAAGQPSNAPIRLQLANLLLDIHKDDEARRQFQAVLEMVPDDAQARYSLGVLAQRAGNLEAAKRHWQQIVKSAPAFLRAHVALAEVAMQEHDFALAERHLRQALKQARYDASVASALAWILATSPSESQRNGEEAVRLAEKACELTQRSQHAYLDTLAAAYAELGRFDDAVKTIREALRLAEEMQDQEATATYQQHLTLYEKQQPYRRPE